MSPEYQGNALEKPRKKKGQLLKNLVLTGLLAGSIGVASYVGMNLSHNTDNTVQKEVTTQKQEESEPRVRREITKDYPSLDDILKTRKEPETKKEPEAKAEPKPIHVDPYNSTTIDKAMEAMDYSPIEDLAPGLQKEAKEKLREIFSSEWDLKKYPEIFTKLTKFDEILDGIDHYALLAQEIGPYVLNKEKIPESKAGATGWAQMMEIAKKENGIKHNDSVDFSYHLIEGIEGLVNHYERYNPKQLENLNSRFMLGKAIYNTGYGNVMGGLAKLIKEDGGDPTDYFVFSEGDVNAIKDPEKLDAKNWDWERLKTILGKETEGYLAGTAAYMVLLANEDKISNISIEQQPSIKDIFAEKKLGEYETVYDAWEKEGKDKNIGWDTYRDYVQMHIKNFGFAGNDTRILVPVKEIPDNYF